MHSHVDTDLQCDMTHDANDHDHVGVPMWTYGRPVLDFTGYFMCRSRKGSKAGRHTDMLWTRKMSKSVLENYSNDKTCPNMYYRW